MKYSDSGAADAAAEAKPAVSARNRGSRLHRGDLAGLVVENAEVGLYVLYVLALLLMLAFYFINPPAERQEFYRQSLAVWKASAEFAFRGTGPRPAPPPPAKVAIPAGQAVIGYLDQVGDRPVISVAEGDELHLSGWAACSNAFSPLAKVEILVDNQTRANAAMSFPRHDVAAVFGRPDFELSGWNVSFSAQGIKAGTHPIAARATCTEGETSTLPPFQLVVKAK